MDTKICQWLKCWWALIFPGPTGTIENGVGVVGFPTFQFDQIPIASYDAIGGYRSFGGGGAGSGVGVFTFGKTSITPQPDYEVEGALMRMYDPACVQQRGIDNPGLSCAFSRMKKSLEQDYSFPFLDF